MKYFQLAAILALFSCSCIGQEWRRIDVPFTAKMLAEGNGRIVAIDGGYTALARVHISEDLTNWTERATPFAQQIYDLRFGNGVFVGIGFQTSYVSSDGMNWTAQRLFESGYQLAVGDGKFVTAGYGGWIMTSQDAKTWQTTQITNNYPFFMAGTFGNGRFVLSDSGRSFCVGGCGELAGKGSADECGRSASS